MFNYALTLSDANGQVVARSTPSGDNGLSEAFVNLVPSITGRNVPSPHDLYAFGAKWKLEVVGKVSAADPDLPLPGVIGNNVTVALTALGAKAEAGPMPETCRTPPNTPPAATTHRFATPRREPLADRRAPCSGRTGPSPRRTSRRCRSR